MRSYPALALVASLILGASPAAAAPHLVRILPNKMTVVVRQVSTRPVVSIQAWVRAGARDDPAGQRGVSEVLSRCLFEKTSRRERGAILKEIAALGGTAGAETRYGYTVYSINVASRFSNQALDYLSDAIMHSQPDSAIIVLAKDKERTESERTLNAPERASINVVRDEIHAGTALTAPFAAPPVEIAALTVSMLQRFYRAQYVAENLMIVAAGDVDPVAFSQRVERAFADMPTGKAPSRGKISERSFQGPRAIVTHAPKGAENAAITLGFRAPAWGTADALALDVLMALLVDSPTSRLHARTAEGSPITLAAAYRDFEPDGGTITYSLVGPASRLQEAEGIALNEFEKARSAPVSSGEFRDAVEAVLTRELYPRNEFAGIAKATALAHLQGTDGSDEVYFQRLRALRPEDLVAVGRKYLDMKQAVVVEMAPDSAMSALGGNSDLARRLKDKTALYGAAYRSGPPVSASTDAERKARVDAPLAAIPTAPLDAGRGRVERSTLAGGTRLLVGEDHSAPLVTVGVYLAGGVRYENDKTNGVTELVRELLLNTVDPKGNGRSYRQSLPNLGNLTPYQDRDLWGYSISVPAEAYPEALRRLGAMLAHSETDTVAVDATRLFVLSELDKWIDDESAQRARLIFTTKYQVSGYRLPGLGTHNTIIKLPHKDVIDFYHAFVVKPNLVVTLFGDVRAADVKPVVEEAMHDVPDRPFAPGTIPQEGSFEGFREKWELGGGEYTTVSVAFDGPPASSPDIPAMYVINSVISGPKGWFAQYVLTQDFVTNATSKVAYALDESPIIATADIRGSQREEDGARLLFRQFKKIGLLPLEGTIALELVNAKAHAIGTFCSELDSNGGRAFQFARAELFHLSPDYVLSLPAKMDALSASDLTAVGTRYFQKDDFVRQPYSVAETRPGGW